MQKFFAIRHKQAFFSEIRPAGEISTVLWKNMSTMRTSEITSAETPPRQKTHGIEVFTPHFALVELSPKVQ